MLSGAQHFIPRMSAATFPRLSLVAFIIPIPCRGTASGMGGFLDTGSTALYVSDATTLNIGPSDHRMPIRKQRLRFYCVSGGMSATLSNVNLIGNGRRRPSFPCAILRCHDACSRPIMRLSRYGSDSGPQRCPATIFLSTSGALFLGRTIFVRDRWRSRCPTGRPSLLPTDSSRSR